MEFKKTLYKLAYKTKEASPAILMVAGLVGFGVTVVLACKETTKVEEIIDEHKKNMDDIKDTLARCTSDDPTYKETEYTNEDARRDKVIFAAKTSVKLVKNYAPAIIAFTLSAAAILSSYKILQTRYVAASALAATISEAFTKYRERVRKDYGDDVDKHLYYGTEYAEVTEDKGDGKVETKEVEFMGVDKNNIPLYAKFFDESCKQWNKNPEVNLMFLKGIEARLNDKFHKQGYLLLNQAYRALDIPETDLGCEVGWFESHGDQFIDFGIFNGSDERKRAFVNGYEPSILLAFNCVPRWEGDLPKF